MAVLDWRPPRYIISRGTFPKGASFVATDEVIPSDDGVTVRKSMRPLGRLDDEGMRCTVEALAPMLDAWIPTLIEKLNAELATCTTGDVEPPAHDESQRLDTAAHQAVARSGGGPTSGGLDVLGNER